MKTKSNLLNYISHLMHDDDALYKFSVDPITTAEQEHGLTKAERAVLRRTVNGLSNNSVNGYSIQRSLDSYRRSLRLLQNVLHHVGNKMVMDNIEASDGLHTYSVQIYCPIIEATKHPLTTKSFTKSSNHDVDKYGGPYAAYTIPLGVYKTNKTEITIEELMKETNCAYTKTDDGLYVKSFLFNPSPNTVEIIADLSQYNVTDDYVFWFYTINGTPNKGGTPHPGGSSGKIGESFTKKTLQPNDTVYWQLIAPDSTYGFQSCAPHEQNEYAKAIRQKV